MERGAGGSGGGGGGGGRIRQKARGGAAVLRGREERFLPTRPGAQTTRARKNRAAPFGMTGWSGARDAQPLQAGLNCDAPPALQSGWRDELAATRMGRGSSRRKRGMGRRSSEEEKRDSSLRGPARKQRAQEKTGPLRSE